MPSSNVSPQNPLAKSMVTCPVCDTVSHQYRIKESYYIESEPDIDLYPRRLSWLKKGFDHLHPRHFYMNTCTECGFTAGYPFFEQPVKDCAITSVRFKKELGDMMGTRQDVKDMKALLREGIDLKAPDLYQALKLHYLAIFQLQLFDELKNRDAINMGRYLLRLAWLFRDMDDHTAQANEVKYKADKLGTRIKPLWPQAPMTVPECIQGAVDSFRNTIEKSQGVTTIGEQVALYMLLARLLMTQERIPEASLVMSRAKEAVRKLEAKRKQIRDDPKRQEQLRAEIRRLKNKIDEVMIIFEDRWEAFRKDQLEKGRALLASMGKTLWEEQRELLRQNGIHERIVVKLVPEPKKGFLGFFKG